MANTAKRFSQDNKEALRNPWVIGWIAAIVFVLGVNIAFIITAMLTNPGLVDEDYYEKGRNHEQNFQKKLEARNRLGWQLKLQIPERPVLGREARYYFNAVDRAGLPLTGATATLSAYRPSDANADFSVPMVETSPGVYQAEVAFPLKGAWELTARLQRDEDSLALVRRISVLAN